MSALPQDVASVLDEFVAAAGSALGEDLVSIVLFGSAAEGRLRSTSDVNVMLVLARWEPSRVDALRETLRMAHATIRLEAMMVLESELADAAEAFAVKFGDIRLRHRILAGRDVVASLQPSRDAMRIRVRQILLNYMLRTRERYALVSLREEQLAPLVAESAGPLRAAARMLLELEGRPVPSPRESLETVAREAAGERFATALANLASSRETGVLPAGAGRSTILDLIELARLLHERASTVR